MTHPAIKNVNWTTAPVSPSWPKRPDGSNKTMGEMTKEERREQIRASVSRVAYEFSLIPDGALH